MNKEKLREILIVMVSATYHKECKECNRKIDQTIASILELEKDEIEKHAVEIEQAEFERDRYRELLILILPMAKGYAYKNDVGSNMEYIRRVEQALEQIGECNHEWVGETGYGATHCKLCGKSQKG